MIKTILFDVGSVLSRTDWDPLYANFAKRTGILPETVAEYHDKYLNELLLGEKTFADFIRDVNISLDVEEAKRIWVEEALPLTHVNKELFDIVDGLRGQYMVQIVSNLTESRMLTDHALNLYSHVDQAWLSCKEHLKKPDPRFYELALAHAQADPTEALFFDDLEKQVTAAQQLGIKGVVFRSNDDVRQALANIQ